MTSALDIFESITFNQKWFRPDEGSLDLNNNNFLDNFSKLDIHSFHSKGEEGIYTNNEHIVKIISFKQDKQERRVEGVCPPIQDIENYKKLLEDLNTFIENNSFVGDILLPILYLGTVSGKMTGLNVTTTHTSYDEELDLATVTGGEDPPPHIEFKDSYYLVTERCETLTLNDPVAGVSETLTDADLIQILEKIKKLSSKGIIHGDIKLQNLVKKNGDIMFIDYEDTITYPNCGVYADEQTKKWDECTECISYKLRILTLEFRRLLKIIPNLNKDQFCFIVLYFLFLNNKIKRREDDDNYYIEEFKQNIMDQIEQKKYFNGTYHPKIELILNGIIDERINSTNFFDEMKAIMNLCNSYKEPTLLDIIVEKLRTEFSMRNSHQSEV